MNAQRDSTSYVFTAMDHADTLGFIDTVRKELNEGYGFIPFIGAGFSVSAGIPIVQQLRSYLNRCICVALGAEGDPTTGVRQLWNPRTDRWPPFIDTMRPEPKDWQGLVYRRLCEERVPNGRPQIFQEGFGAMAEWRTSLLFLSRLNLNSTRAREMHPFPILELPRQDVIDACLREIMRHKKPTLNHMMLGSLSGPLRIDLILSTNFDSLLEKAFDSKHIHLQTFEVPLGSPLPDYVAISQARTLIKLHGGLYSLRADYSLDAPPTESETATFLTYLAGGNVPITTLALSAHQKRHIVVIGIGASEKRSLAFIRAAWNLPELKIFWVCYSEEQLRNVVNFRNECLLASNKPSSHFVIIRHTEAGLLLLHLYQAIRKTIPPGGIIFPSATRIPVPPLEAHANDEIGVNSPKSRVSMAAERLFQALSDRAAKLYKLVVMAGSAGVTSACYRVYRILEPDNFCLWIDLNDISNTDNLFETIQEACYFKLGQEDWTPLYAAKDSEKRPRSAEIVRITKAGNKPWVIILNAREKPDANRRAYSEANGWLDRADLPEFLKLLDDLCSNESRLMTVILLCRDEHSPLMLELKRTSAQRILVEDNWGSYLSPYEPLTLDKNVLEWIAIEPSIDAQLSKRRFLFALALMQRPRFLSSAWTSATQPDVSSHLTALELSDVFHKADSCKADWFRDLEGMGLIRWLDGGFIWFHSERRERVRSLLRTQPEALQEERNIHKDLAAWYTKVFASTGSAPAIFEAVDHYCFATECCLRECSLISGGETVERAMERACVYLASARRLLRDHSFLIQTHGHPRNSVRRLDLIRDFWEEPLHSGVASRRLDVLFAEQTKDRSLGLRTSIAKLQCMCVEIARAVFREIGEDGLAYRRQRELQLRSITNDPLSACDIAPRIDYARKASGMMTMIDALAPRTHGILEEDRSPEVRPQDLVRWWRWCAMLAIASRSFDRAEHSLHRGLSVPLRRGAMYEPSGAKGLRLEEFDVKQLRRIHVFNYLSETPADQHWNLRKTDDWHKLLLEVLHCLELAVYLLLSRSNTIQRRCALLQIDPSCSKTITYLTSQQHVIDTLLGTARGYVERGLKLAEQILTAGAFERESDFYAAWCKSRLLMHYALLSLHDDDELHKNYSRHAMSYLGDSQAALRGADPHRYRAELALIELHRAEVRLVESSRCRLYGEFPFERWTYDRLRQPVEEATAISQILKADAMGECYGVRTVLLEVCSRSFDALRYLDQAEPMLRERRRNVWWTTWFFERRLRAMASILWCSVVEEGSPIPFLGLEAAMRLTETEADSLLKTAVRMIRVDAYRLATIILSYASCARALQVRLILDKRTVELPERLNEMRVNINTGLNELERIESQRNDVRDDDRADAMAQEFIADVKILVSRIEQSLLSREG